MLMVPVRRVADWSAHRKNIQRNAVIMDGKFESPSNKYDESNVNRLHFQRSASPRRKARCRRALPGAHAVGEAAVAGAIGQTFDRRVSAEAEMGGTWRRDRPAAGLGAELKQRASVSVVDRRLRFHRVGDRRDRPQELPPEP